jgi:hypothetical protein
VDWQRPKATRLSRPAPRVAPRHKPKPHGELLQNAIKNVRDAFPFPKGIHYMIARGGFLSRLAKL